jgi:hypothetical protein
MKSKNTKMNIKKFAVLVGAGALIATSFAFADNATTTTGAPLAVTCTANVSGNVIAWSALATGGTAPYHFVWSNDSSVVGNTNQSFTRTYSANGTYMGTVTATDSASSTAISSCSGTVTSIGTTLPPTIHPLVMNPMLSISGNGRFLARGMKVTSVGVGSFQAMVWGITYTVNWTGNINSELWFRFNKAGATSTISNQLTVGDEVGVSGVVTPDAPLVVKADVVRDYSVITPRLNGNGNEGEGNNHGGVGSTISGILNSGASNSIGDAQGRLNDLLKQLQGLQDLFKKNNSGNGGNGNSSNGNH